MPKTDDAAPQAEPLTPDEAGRMSHLLGKGETIQPDEHAELAQLHAKATAFAEAWKPDAEAAMMHLVGVFEQTWAALSYMAATIPAAGGIAMTLRSIRTTLDALKLAAVPPRPPAELPPPPEPEAAPADPDPNATSAAA